MRATLLAALLGILLAGCQATGLRFASAKLDGADSVLQVSAGLAKPDGPGPFPAVVLLHSCGGMQNHVSSDWPGFLKSHGYVVMAVDSFGSRGLGSCPNALHASPPLDRAYREITRDAYGALDWLEQQAYVRKGKVAVMGFSLGANVINSYLVRFPRTGGPGFAAAAAVYGRCHDVWSLKAPPMPLMQLAGELDTRHIHYCRIMQPPVEVHVLPGAHHSWDDAQASGRTSAYGDVMRYSPSATARSRELVLDFLGRHLK
ncbi:MAG: dienelactone hydrolase family protein [Burkholderiales bacterium]|nr:dienelactone hydrolase family protein [Burkholderiales bacterium]